MTRPVGVCRCGKRQYPRRRDARRAARVLHPGHHMRPYRCGQHWHIGHIALWRVRGMAS